MAQAPTTTRPVKCPCVAAKSGYATGKTFVTFFPKALCQTFFLGTRASWRRLVRALLLVLMATVPLTVSASVVSDWNKFALAGVRVAKQGPAIVARSLAIARTCICTDAWASYNDKAWGAVVGDTLRRPAARRRCAARAQKPSAMRPTVAWRNVFPTGQTRLRAAMTAMGCRP